MEDLSRINGKKSRKGLWISLVVIVILLIGAGVGGYQYYTIQKDKTDYSALNVKSKKEVQVQVKSGATASEIASELSKAKVLRSERAFMNYVTVNNVSDLKAGYYLFSPADNVKTIVKSLRQGGAAYPLNGKDTITVREGETIENIATEVGEKTNFTKDEFLKAVNDQDFFNSLKEAYPGLLDSEVDSQQAGDIRYKLEGYLYPATYDWKTAKTVNELINQMVYQDYVQMKDKFDAIKKSGMTVHQVLTLASLVEREGIDEASRKTIAGVFENRLAINMPLQSDIATKYALDTNKTNLSNSDVQSDNPYNLYKFSGYGPGPFNNPSSQSVDAVLNPSDRDKGYLYFVANLKTGKVYYSKDYDEHLGKSGDLEATNQSVGSEADAKNSSNSSSK
ncbi:endolytic transglycosylase MltG [Weissella confusa]|uniref:endolytic transglycosylase MltG n=1 Tax=Weissella confusa TaxID=1583 RepID=UPI0018F24CD8|nr:endolytic transglycosylase MltG [Weissella confusa]MBJ7691876.1 endolytic transglycosylase MltG [Weissella confusa]